MHLGCLLNITKCKLGAISVIFFSANFRSFECTRVQFVILLFGIHMAKSVRNRVYISTATLMQIFFLISWTFSMHFSSKKNLSFILIKSIQNICLASFFKLYQYDRYLDKICDTQHKLSFMREMKIAPKNNANDNYQTSVKSSS